MSDCRGFPHERLHQDIESENTRLRHYLARLHRKTLCYSKSEEMLQLSIRLLIYYLKYHKIPLSGETIS
ncbi:IS1 family transposase [Moorena sp. SIO4G3]|uniref:IS1 family transposase n=1 Tax=Moorena sp. SIO4G3 TaxID=2607821 RepID=UPI0025F1C42F|nr:IS1 family transposase [Moorena sp. SIO4G3]